MGKYDEGEEFIDCNRSGSICQGIEKWRPELGNGIWDEKEPFVDLGNGKWDGLEPFVDLGNGRYDRGEEFTDAKNGKYDKGEEFEDIPRWYAE